MTFALRRTIAALLLCVFTLQTVVGNAVAGDLAGSGAAEYGAFPLREAPPRATTPTRTPLTWAQTGASGGSATVTETFDTMGRHAVTHTALDDHQDVQVSNLAGLPAASQSTSAGGG